MVKNSFDPEIDYIPAEISDYLAVNLTDRQTDQLTAYLRLLVKWNKSVNLVSRKNVESVLKDRLFDAMLIWREVRIWNGLTHLDIGSGAGFPAIPIHVMAPESKLLMVDSRAKRVAFLSAVAAELSVPNIEIRQDRVDLGRNADISGRRFDIVTAQAVTDIDKIVPIAISSLADNGRYVTVVAADSGNLREPRFKKEDIYVTETAHTRPDGKQCKILQIMSQR